MAKNEPKVAKVTEFKQHEKTSSKTVAKNLQQEKPSPSSAPYSRFEEINGWHPWQDEMPGSYITYPVRVIEGGEVAYFNFALAKEMGLIPKSHPEKFNKTLEKKIIETFSLQVINEYDQLHKRRFPKDKIKPNEYMATRYLQLQHVDKTGKTSGDGRSIWNGVIENDGVVWDVSSRGTGVTALAPGMVQANKPLETGSEEFGYGCGLAEIDELFATAILSEIFHNQGIETERMLAVIDNGDGIGIGVRAGRNLIRPAHFFNHLKQGDHKNLETAIDYLIQRQYKNGDWNFSAKHPKKYDLLLEEIAKSFAQFTAILDVDYIFAWLDWDGDNVLANAGIIDYGSIRQFGLRYDQYRYDDVERFSTTLNEQKQKAQLMVQVFVQAIDFLRTKEKKSLKHFKEHKTIKLFQQSFEMYRLKRMLFRVGFDESNSRFLISNHYKLVEKFAEAYDFIERKKTSEPVAPVSDGVNRQALFNIRNILREYPKYLLKQDSPEMAAMSENEFYEILFAEEIAEDERKLTATLCEKATAFQELYIELVEKARRRRGFTRQVEDLEARASKINANIRVTGNSIVFVVEEILTARKNGVSNQDIHGVIQKFIGKQSLDPDNPYPEKRPKFKSKNKSEKLYNEILTLVKNHNEDL